MEPHDNSVSVQVGYHSLMNELTQVIRKKPSPSSAPRDRDDTSSADFNRKLEAALQDIQDLDSSTGDTVVNASSAASSSAPPPPAPDWGDSDEESSASSRTVSGKRRSHPRLGRAFAIPVPPPVPPPGSGGTLRGTLRGTLPGSLRRQSRYQRDFRASDPGQRDDTPSPEPPPPPPPPSDPPPAVDADALQSPVRSKTVVTICNGDMVVREMNNNDLVLPPDQPPPEIEKIPPTPEPEGLLSPFPTPSSPDVENQGCSMGSVGRLGGLSLLRKGRSRNRRSSSGCNVRLSQELQGAVLQSESLVFLSDSELVARHERNRRVQRVRQRQQSGDSGLHSA